MRRSGRLNSASHSTRFGKTRDPDGGDTARTEAEMGEGERRIMREEKEEDEEDEEGRGNPYSHIVFFTLFRLKKKAVETVLRRSLFGPNKQLFIVKHLGKLFWETMKHRRSIYNISTDNKLCLYSCRSSILFEIHRTMIPPTPLQPLNVNTRINLSI